MSYETHLTMLINGLTTCVYSYIVLMLFDMSMTMFMVFARIVPPTDYVSFLLNVYMSLMTGCLALAMKRALQTIFFADALKVNMTKPLDSKTFVFTDGTVAKYNRYNTPDMEDSNGPLTKLIIIRSSNNQEPTQPTEQTTATPATPEPQANPSPPGTPNTELSEASTSDSINTETEDNTMTSTPAKMTKGPQEDGEIKPEL